MKSPLFLALLALAVCAPASAADASLEDRIDAMNYPLRDVLRPQCTYAGVIADACPVTVRVGPQGLVPQLTLGIGNSLFGTHIGATKLTAYQYVVRLDAPTVGSLAEIVTVVQGGNVLYAPGTPCFIVTRGSPNGPFSARIIPSQTPQAYQARGLEETRLENQRIRYYGSR